jgi:hypothetical protein
MQAPSDEFRPGLARLGQRFAIGDFPDWRHGFAFVDGLLRSGTDANGIGLLGSAEKLRSLNDRRDGRLGPLRDLTPGRDTDPRVACIGEEVFGLLSEEGQDGGADPRRSLERWLMPSHARRLWAALSDGHLLVWIAVGSAEQECGVCLGLLQSSGRTVQVHDFGVA